MSDRAGVTIRWSAAAVGALALVAIGGLASYVLLHPGNPAPGETASAPTPTVIVGEAGYEPTRITMRAGIPARITFLRTTDKTCGTEVVFPSMNLRKDLPLNTPVDIEFTPASRGEVAFACGMNMLQGTVVVE